MIGPFRSLVHVFTPVAKKYYRKGHIDIHVSSHKLNLWFQNDLENCIECYLLEKLEDERAADVDMADVDVKLQVFVVKRFFEFLDMWNVVLLFWLPRIQLIMFIERHSGKVDCLNTQYSMI